MEAFDERIARKAYELYEQRGRQHGHELEDWLEAERIILAEMKAQIAKLTNTARRNKPSPEHSSLKTV